MTCTWPQAAELSPRRCPPARAQGQYLPQAEFGSDFIHHLSFWVFKKLQAVLCPNLAASKGETDLEKWAQKSIPLTAPLLTPVTRSTGLPRPKESDSSSESSRPPGQPVPGSPLLRLSCFSQGPEQGDMMCRLWTPQPR